MYYVYSMSLGCFCYCCCNNCCGGCATNDKKQCLTHGIIITTTEMPKGLRESTRTISKRQLHENQLIGSRFHDSSISFKDSKNSEDKESSSSRPSVRQYGSSEQSNHSDMSIKAKKVTLLFLLKLIYNLCLECKADAKIIKSDIYSFGKQNQQNWPTTQYAHKKFIEGECEYSLKWSSSLFCWTNKILQYICSTLFTGNNMYEIEIMLSLFV